MEEKNDFEGKLISGEYIKWLNEFTNRYSDFDDVFFTRRHENQYEVEMIGYLENLFQELKKYAIKNDIDCENDWYYILSYKDKTYLIESTTECNSCRVINNNVSSIKYEDFIKSVEKNMKFNFKYLKGRVIDSLENTDLEFIRRELSNLDEPTIFSGVGGSSVVSDFASKVVNHKNGIITINSEPRDFIYRKNAFKNVVSCSYGGNNYGVKLSFLKDLKKYLLSNNSYNEEYITYLKYNTTIDSENSFISLGATLIPVSILMDYYLDGKDDFIDLINEKDFNFDTRNNIYEIFSGLDTSSASSYLESTMIESGIGVPIVHDKYSYCHGRSTLSKNFNSNVIYFNRNTDFDKFMLEELKKYYNNIIIINSKFDDQILDDYQMLIQVMYLTKYLAEKKKVDMSKVDYCPIVKQIYKYHGII